MQDLTPFLRAALSYDTSGNVATSTDALNRVTSFQYDQKNRLKTVTDPATGSTTESTSDSTTPTTQTGGVAAEPYPFVAIGESVMAGAAGELIVGAFKRWAILGSNQ